MASQLQQEHVKASKIVRSIDCGVELRKTKICGYFQEDEICKVQQLIATIKDGRLGEENEELAKLQSENSKLKFRLEVLHKVRLCELFCTFHQIIAM